MGDKVVNTITALLIRCGFKANSFAGVIEIDNSSVASVQHALKEMLLSGLPSAFDLATDVPEKYLDKYDEYLPESLLKGMVQRRMKQKVRASGCRNIFSNLDM
jgi:ATP-dependent Lhr-like helicase